MARVTGGRRLGFRALAEAAREIGGADGLRDASAVLTR